MRELTFNDIDNVDGGMAPVAAVAIRVVAGVAIGGGVGIVVGVAAYLAYEYITS